MSDEEVEKMAHWQWEREEYILNRGMVRLGKKNILNNFCVGITGNGATCTKCHTSFPHKNRLIDQYTLKVDCQTCHIPLYAKVNSTNMYWDWSTAGRLKDGKPFSEEDSLGNHTYMSIKGSFKWARNVEPEYVWLNGTADYYLVGDTINSHEVVQMNSYSGNYRDAQVKITPVKVHRAQVPFDTENKTLIQLLLFAREKRHGALWKDFDWAVANEKGMALMGQPYSGKFDFVESAMYERLNHMVALKE